jgi:hypothetical protein
MMQLATDGGDSVPVSFRSKPTSNTDRFPFYFKPPFDFCLIILVNYGTAATLDSHLLNRVSVDENK